MGTLKEQKPINSSTNKKDKLELKRKSLLERKEKFANEYQILLTSSAIKNQKYFEKLHSLDVKRKRIDLKLELIEKKLEKLERSVGKTVNIFHQLQNIYTDFKYVNKHIARYASIDEVDEIKEELLQKKAKLEAKLQEVTKQYIREASNENVKARTRRKVFTLSKRMKDLKKQVNQLNIDLMRLDNGKYEVLSFFGKIKKFFANMTYQQQKALFGILFIVPWIIGFIIFFASPFGTTLWWSLNKMDAQTGGDYIYKFVWFENFRELFTEKTLGGITISETLATSMLGIIFDLLTIIIFSLLVAILLNSKFKGYQIARAIFFIPVVYNLTVINNTLSGAFGQIFDSELGNTIILSDQFSNFVRQIGIGTELVDFLVTAVDRIFSIVNKSGIQIIIFIAALQSIPKHLYEAANIEGATKYEMFWKITIPMVSPMILTAIVYTVVDSFASSELIDFMTVNSQGTTMATNQPGLFSAIAIIYFLANALIILLVFLFMRKRVFYYDK